MNKKIPLKTLILRGNVLFRGFKGDPDWIQTNDPKLRRFVLYSAELPGLNNGGKDRRNHYLIFITVKKT